MKNILFCCFIVLIFFSCNKTSKKFDTASKDDTITSKEVKEGSETLRMVMELAELVRDGNPKEYYHWNSKQAELLIDEMGKGSPNKQLNTWLQYIEQSLNAGNNQSCIDSITTFLKKENLPYSEIITSKNRVIFELLAMAYLRLGERENCQVNHTSQSCILPIKKDGLHLLKTGSENAIEIYTLLQNKFPTPKYKWLINVAYMTLGSQNNMPSQYKINYPSKSEQKNFPVFKEIAMELGVANDGLSGGTSIDDFNNDGFLDIFMTSYGMEDNVQLFLNDGKGGFTNDTKESGLEGITSGLNCIHADYDNDGLKDILVLRGGWLGKAGTHPNSLLKNMGNGVFKDVTYSSNLISYHPTQTASWGDFNNDGNLDLFIGNESKGRFQHPCELFMNNGDGTFSEVADKYGLGKIITFVKGVAWGDINNDGWQDLYISVLGRENLLFKNEQGKNFIEIGRTAGVNEPFYSFPCWFWDVNNDGYQDLFVGGYDMLYYNNLAGEYAKELQDIEISSEKPKLYLNNGDDTFTESAEKFNISKTMFAMGSNFGDLDNDGYLDFYVGTGSPDFSTIVPNRMFRNVNGKRFEEVTSSGNFGHIQKGHGIAFADIDRDGDQDIYAVMGGAYEGDNFTNILYDNPISKNNWIVIELKGTANNRSAIGTKLELVLDNGRKLFRTVGTGGSFGASSIQQEIGMGKAQKIDQLTIHWANEETQLFRNIHNNQKIYIEQGSANIQQVNYDYVPFKLKKEHRH